MDVGTVYREPREFPSPGQILTFWSWSCLEALIWGTPFFFLVLLSLEVGSALGGKGRDFSST